MTDQHRHSRHADDNPAETRLQADPMLRAGRVPWGWTVLIAAAFVVLAVVLFAANEDDDDVADTATDETPVVVMPAPAPTPERGTTGSAPR